VKWACLRQTVKLDSRIVTILAILLFESSNPAESLCQAVQTELSLTKKGSAEALP
jgi:hypothetical protein